ncbi:hypothetical protein S349_70 [Shewanella sp. phage 3/49]|uniref:hypothetical protein n=1 Tax=Shewanella sp. phage 3/49 TaxID=1458863 RepID=UPI0004F8A2B3|nr:hypothetical protein S349_70 [Shewanella sp. phage 3/49]AHK11860.1 hypothetical protein S349_70 [Shewanella sp. phage 3/49]
MIYQLDIEIHGVTKPGEVSIDEDGAIELLYVFIGDETIDLSDLLKCPDIYNSIEHDYLALIANMEV